MTCDVWILIEARKCLVLWAYSQGIPIRSASLSAPRVCSSDADQQYLQFTSWLILRFPSPICSKWCNGITVNAVSEHCKRTLPILLCQRKSDLGLLGLFFMPSSVTLSLLTLPCTWWVFSVFQENVIYRKLTTTGF